MGEENEMVNDMNQPKCRFCDADQSFQKIKGDFVYGGREEQHFWQCEKCQMIYLNPPMTEEEEDKFYKQEFEKFMLNRAGDDKDWSGPEKHFASNQGEVARRLPQLMPFVKEGVRVLEIGCSSGFMLSALKDKGCDVCGVDPSGVFVDYVRSKDIPVYDSCNDVAKQEDPFDLIIHYYVLEHVRYPVKFLQIQMGLLKDGGIMVFEVPCASDPLVELYAIPAFDKFYWSAAHHWYFNKESLSRVLEKIGVAFDLYPQQRYDLSNHMVWMLQGKPGGAGKYSQVFGEELDNAYKEQLKKKWLCDTIMAVLKK